jgi:microcystin-dependent protein
MWFAISTPPPGWIRANGAVLNRADFPSLWAAVGGEAVTEAQWIAGFSGRFSSGNGSTTFRVPELRGEFLRPWDESRGADPGRQFGTFQSSQNLSHTHGANSGTSGSHTHSVSSGNAGSHSHTGITGNAGSHNHNYVNHNAGFAASGGTLFAGIGAGGDAGTSFNGDHQHDVFTNPAGDHNHPVFISPDGAHSHSITVLGEGGSEARPRNIALALFIKT